MANLTPTRTLAALAILAGHAWAMPKILVLHGGGMNGASMQNSMQTLEANLSSTYEFVYADGGYAGIDCGQTPCTGSGRLWIRDPPGGKGAATTDPGWADASFKVLDDIVTAQGPFYGILGYSQGSAFVSTYLAHAATGTFKVAFMFCGYHTETHTGLMGLVNSKAPFGGIPALVWQGYNDGIISNDLTAVQASKYTTPTKITSSSGGHAVPGSDDPTYTQVVDFMKVTTRDGTGGGGDVVIGTPNTGSSSGGGKGTGKDTTGVCDPKALEADCAAISECTFYAGWGCYAAKGIGSTTASNPSAAGTTTVLNMVTTAVALVATAASLW